MEVGKNWLAIGIELNLDWVGIGFAFGWRWFGIGFAVRRNWAVFDLGLGCDGVGIAGRLELDRSLGGIGVAWELGRNWIGCGRGVWLESVWNLG